MNKIVHISATIPFVITTILLTVAIAAKAEPGDDEEVAKARLDYERAMKTHDIGLQNAMKIELAVQLAKAKELRDKKADDGSAKHKNDSDEAKKL